MQFKTGDEVKLKEPIQGRYFFGKVKGYKDVQNGKELCVNLPNGLYVCYPEEMWEKTEVTT